jgi:hypothetical protein
VSLRWRTMQPQDVPACAEIVASHSVIGPRYGAAIKNLRRVWFSLLGSEAMTTAVFEEVVRDQVHVVGFGVGLFVRDEFIRELKTPPQFWVGPELIKRVLKGASPALSDREVREANSDGGLNELVWETIALERLAKRTDLYHLMGRAYIEIHRGYRFKEMITSQAESPERLQWAVDAGGLCWDPGSAKYVKSPTKSNDEFARRPHVVGITRELEFERPGSWIGVLFDYHAPRIWFSPAEQRLLRAAISSRTETNPALAKKLGVSLPAVKKLWLSIYTRVAHHAPEVMAGPDKSGDERKRGAEKKRRLLAHLEEHPEELRPLARRAVRRPSSQPPFKPRPPQG